MRSISTIAIVVIAATSILATPLARAKDKWPVALTEIDDRPGKTLRKAAFGSNGQLGAFFDVDADGHKEFVALERDGKDLSLTVLQVDSDRYSVRLEFGRAAAAGLTAVNLDADDQLEYIVGYGERLEGLKRGLVLFASAVFGTVAAVDVGSMMGHSVFLAPVLVPGSATDLKTVLAVDDDGSILWQRDLSAEATDWNETRFKWVVPSADGSGATILITDDAQHALMGLSAADGRTLWQHPLQGDAKASDRLYASLIDGEQLLPVLFTAGRALVLEPATGAVVFDGEIRRRITEFPSWHVFRTDEGRSFLAFGEERNELNMISLETGDVLWTHTSDEILEVLPMASGDTFISVMEQGIEIIDAAGKVVAAHTAPNKIKTKTPPIYRDLNNDGRMEFVYVSKKDILCWQIESGELRWEGDMSGLAGAANPTEIYSALYDVNDDGWLDVPARKGNGTGRWLSGANGEILIEVGNGSTEPVIGDWNGNGRVEIFWHKKWYEVSPGR